MTDFWQHQQDELKYTQNPARALFWEARVGKTRPIVEQLRLLHFNRVLITGPIMALRMSWKVELKALLDKSIIVDLTQGTTVKRAAAIQALIDQDIKHVILLINLESIKPLENVLLKFKAQAIVVDEAHLIKSVSAQRSVSLCRLGRLSIWRRILTGTPVPKNYIDLYSQFKFLDPEVFGTQKEVFMHNYCIMHPYFQNQITGYKNLPDLERRMLTRTTRVLKKDCHDMPDSRDIPRDVELSPAVWDAYKKLVKAQKVELNALESEPNPDRVSRVQINGAHRLARYTKLAQLTAGFGSDPRISDSAVWVHREKLVAVIDELTEHVENGAYVIVSYWYKHEGRELEHTISKFFGDAAIVARLSGDTPQRDRERITAPFVLGATDTDTRSSSLARILIVQEKVGGLGISLARADHMIITSTSMDAASHSQMRDRIWAPSKKITYTYVRVPNSIDYTIKAILDKKITAQQILMDIGFEDAAFGKTPNDY